MKKYGVLVVDDSAVMRKAITAVIEQHEQLYVVGIARNGIDAIEKVNRLQPDVVTMDMEMPLMDGLHAIQEIMNECPTAVIVVANDRFESTQALQLGAVDYFVKKQLFDQSKQQSLEPFYDSLLAAVNIKMPKAEPIVLEIEEEVISLPSDYEILLIGSSTGGPSALQQILPHIQLDFPVPIIVVQHMPEGFTKSLANRFNQLCAVEVKEVEHGEILKNGHIYITPAGIHTTFQKNEHGQFVAQQAEIAVIESLYKPSIDVALLSLAPLCKANIVAVILTGMGDDGLRGCKEIKSNGGHIISEHPDSCVIYGMPKVIKQFELCNEQVPIMEMYNTITQVILG